MYLQQQKKTSGPHKGDVYLAIKEKYHVPGVGSREKTVESIGYLSEFTGKYDDPVAHFKEYAIRLTELAKKQKDKTISIRADATLDVGTNDTRNVGYAILKEIYRRLELDKFWARKTRNLDMTFSADRIFRQMTFYAALNTDGNEADIIGAFFGPMEEASEQETEQAQAFFDNNKDDLRTWIIDHVSDISDDMNLSRDDIDSDSAVVCASQAILVVLERLLGNRYTRAQIVHSLRQYNCMQIDSNMWQFTYYDEVIAACAEALDMELDRKYLTRQEIQRLLHY